MSSENLRYRLRSASAVRIATVETSDDECDSDVSDNVSEFCVTDDEVTNAADADEVDEIEEKASVEEGDEFNLELEPASKQRRLNESVRKQRSRGRPHKTLRVLQGLYKWSEEAPDRRGRRSSDTPNFIASPKNDALNARTPVDAFRILFDDAILDKIVLHTNEEITRVILDKTNLGLQSQSFHKEVDKTELCAYFGICFYSAYFKENKLSLKEMWSDVFGRGVYRATLSEKRFEFLTSVLRFDDKNTRDERRKSDKLAPIREIWEIFMQNCTNNYEPSNNCTIDEQLVSFRGRCPFRIYMKNKPDKYGMKILMLNDAETFYMTAAIPYIGKVTPAENDSVPTYFVKALINQASLSGTWRTITMDNWFTSVPLFETLKKDYQIRSIGTIRKNKREIPTTLKAKSAVGSAHFVFSNNLTLVAYTPRKNKTVFVLSSAHHASTINEKTKKPEIIMSYNKYKGGTDAFDQQCHHFTTARRTKRWPLRFLYNMLDQAGINSSILYNFNANNPTLTRNQFLKQLALGLIEPHLRRRLKMPKLRASVKKLISKVLEEDAAPALLQVIRENTRARCAFCDSDANGRTRMRCPNCLRRMCDDHRSALCKECEHSNNNSS